MASLSQVKTYGGIGAILALLLPVPSVGWILALAGFILTLISVKYVSELFNDDSITNNMIVSIIAAVVGVSVGISVILGSLLRFMRLNNLTFTSFGSNFNPATLPIGDWVGLIVSAIGGILVMWASFILSGFFFRRSINRVGLDLNVGLFKTAGLLFLIGVATTIVLVGFLIIPVALILLAVAFFSIKENSPSSIQTIPASG
jgi:uncharacterized membrane protein